MARGDNGSFAEEAAKFKAPKAEGGKDKAELLDAKMFQAINELRLLESKGTSIQEALKANPELKKRVDEVFADKKWNPEGKKPEDFLYSADDATKTALKGEIKTKGKPDKARQSFTENPMVRAWKNEPFVVAEAVLAPEVTSSPEVTQKPDTGSDVVDDWFNKEPSDQTGPGFENPSMTGFKAKITREHGGSSSQESHREDVSGSNETFKRFAKNAQETQKVDDAAALKRQEQIDLQAKMISADFFKEAPDTNPDAWTNPSMTGFEAKRRTEMQSGSATIDSPMKGGVEVGQAMRESEKAGRKDVIDTNKKQGFFSKLFGRNQKVAEKGADVIPFPKKESGDAKEEKAA